MPKNISKVFFFFTYKWSYFKNILRICNKNTHVYGYTKHISIMQIQRVILRESVTWILLNLIFIDIMMTEVYSKGVVAKPPTNLFKWSNIPYGWFVLFGADKISNKNSQYKSNSRPKFYQTFTYWNYLKHKRGLGYESYNSCFDSLVLHEKSNPFHKRELSA